MRDAAVPITTAWLVPIAAAATTTGTYRARSGWVGPPTSSARAATYRRLTERRRDHHPSLVRGRTRIGTRARTTWKPMNIPLRTATVGMSRGRCEAKATVAAMGANAAV